LALFEGDGGGTGGDDDGAAFRHRVPRVGNQVFDYLLHLLRIDVHRVQIGKRLGADVEPGGEALPKPRRGSRDESVEVHALRADDLPAAEGKHLRGQGGCPAGGGPDCVEVFRQLRIAGGRLQRQVTVTEDDLHQVVELVRDSPAELAHRLETPGLRE